MYRAVQAESRIYTLLQLYTLVFDTRAEPIGHWFQHGTNVRLVQSMVVDATLQSTTLFGFQQLTIPRREKYMAAQ
ncbi:hypothetical protein DL89DRAFT_269040 [Linderina pennispora]|uniref:Uncharacterized protein n=1 Tax=Linderina pennispora TaxID=61395 RepID=A0A1Y1W2U7_9FUNG|nr:uncharacterized protein DL89DRAFT_269040 [Linderina pennispora]ORX67859.1 hypothetical protein DL89DRAFT_269040 [Linderina pennispora]